MIGQQNWEDLTYILAMNQDEEESSYVSGVAERGFKVYKARMTFFKSFEGPADFFSELLAIIRHPLAFSIGSVLTAFNTVASACYLAGSLVLALGAAVILQNEYRDAALNAAGEALVHMGRNLLGTIACLLLAVLSIPHNVGSLISRTAALVIPPLADCCPADDSVFLI